MSFSQYQKGEIQMELTCVWVGCRHTIIGNDKLPFGWKYLAISGGSLFIEDNLLGAEIDGVLCPEHSHRLRTLLKVEVDSVKRSPRSN